MAMQAARSGDGSLSSLLNCLSWGNVEVLYLLSGVLNGECPRSCFLRKRWKHFEHHAVLSVISLLGMWLVVFKKKKKRQMLLLQFSMGWEIKDFFPSCLSCFYPKEQKTEAKWCCKIMFKESEQCLLFRRHRPQMLKHAEFPLKYSMFENVGGQKSTSTSQKPCQNKLSDVKASFQGQKMKICCSVDSVCDTPRAPHVVAWFVLGSASQAVLPKLSVLHPKWTLHPWTPLAPSSKSTPSFGRWKGIFEWK